MKAISYAAVLAAFLLPAFPTSIDASEGEGSLGNCRPAARFIESLSATEHVAAHLKDEQAARFMAVYNAVPPKTALQADEVLVLSKDGVANVAVLRFIGGCFQDYGVHPLSLADWVLRNALGQSL